MRRLWGCHARAALPFRIALRGPWKLGGSFLGGAQGRGVRDPHPGVASKTPAVGVDPKADRPVSSRTPRLDRLLRRSSRSLGELQAGSPRSRRVAAEPRAPWPRADADLVRCRTRDAAHPI